MCQGTEKRREKLSTVTENQKNDRLPLHKKASNVSNVGPEEQWDEHSIAWDTRYKILNGYFSFSWDIKVFNGDLDYVKGNGLSINVKTLTTNQRRNG